MTPDDLREIFPNIKPVKRPPPLFRINGCGVTVCGARDHHPETGTYVKTYCLSILFIPVLALSAYRVADAQRGWYFLGKEPLSPFARGWNLLLIAGIAVLLSQGWYHDYMNSPEKRAEEQARLGAKQEAAGDLGGAASSYVDALSTLSSQKEAAEGLRRIVNEKVNSLALSKAIPVFQCLSRVSGGAASWLLPGWLPRWVGRLDAEKEQDPVAALALFDLLRTFTSDPKPFEGMEEKLVETAVAKRPDDVGATVRLAVLLEAKGAMERCEALLSPMKDRLGDTEGARLLGQILARKGDAEGSFKLLLPYFQKRLGAYHAAEASFEQAFRAAEQRALADLNAGHGPSGFRERYDRAGKAEQDQMVDDYIRDRVLHDPAIEERRQALATTGEVVGVALDLGVVRLERAQGMSDPDQRKKELEEAEKVFLAVSGAAGQSDTYRMYLGQVKYWLGKHDEGKKLFDEYVASKRRSAAALTQTAKLLRTLGALSDARPLAEEAYQKATAEAERFAAAGLRALMELDEDDSITWLGRADPRSPDIQASLSYAKGIKAMRAGDDATASARLREAVEQYAKLPDTAVTANNRALALGLLYETTGKKEWFDGEVEALVHAVKLEPDDAIVRLNVATVLLEHACLDLVKDRLDLEVLRPSGNTDVLGYLYDDSAARKTVAERFRAHPDTVAAIEHAEKALVLGPKSPGAYAVLLALYGFLRDADALSSLQRKLDGVSLDLGDETTAAKALYEGKKDDLNLANGKGVAARREGVLDAARKKGSGPTLAAACVDIVRARIALAQFGGTCDPEATASLAEEAMHDSPCAATRGAYVSALFYRALRREEDRLPPVRELAERARRMLGPYETVALALETGDAAVRSALCGDPDVKRATAELVDEEKAFPDWTSGSEWAIVRFVEPSQAAGLATIQRASPALAKLDDLALRLSPMSASAACELHWDLLLAGDGAGARDVLERTAKLGVPLPPR